MIFSSIAKDGSTWYCKFAWFIKYFKSLCLCQGTLIFTSKRFKQMLDCYFFIMKEDLWPRAHREKTLPKFTLPLLPLWWGWVGGEQAHHCLIFHNSLSLSCLFGKLGREPAMCHSEKWGGDVEWVWQITSGLNLWGAECPCPSTHSLVTEPWQSCPGKGEMLLILISNKMGLGGIRRCNSYSFQ